MGKVEIVPATDENTIPYYHDDDEDDSIDWDDDDDDEGDEGDDDEFDEELAVARRAIA